MPKNAKKNKQCKQCADSFLGSQASFFRFKQLGDDYLLTNDAGDWLILCEADWRNFLKGKIKKNSPLYQDLIGHDLFRDNLDFSYLTSRFASKAVSVFQGPSLHIVIVTLRCNYKCIYCHASAESMKEKRFDMSLATARRVVDTIFESPSPAINIELQGGEPLANLDTVKFIIDYARKKNEKEGKNLFISMVSNFTLMDRKLANYFLDKNIALCTSLDGPINVHAKNRIATGGLRPQKGYQKTLDYIKFFAKKAEGQKGKHPHFKPNALTTVTRFSLAYPREIVDSYRKVGLENIYLRPLNPLGFGEKTWGIMGYKAEEFLKFYKKALDYIINLNKKGINFREKFATILLTKILTDKDPAHLDFRSPCGAGIGQVAYNYDGDVYTCDEGRMLAKMGDTAFRIGNIKKDKMKDLMQSDVVRASCAASCLEGLPGCSDCVYAPYCGVCPVYNYASAGNIFAQMPNNERCKTMKSIFDLLFIKLKDKKTREIFENWTKRPPKEV